jgi:hypothetical protein
MNKKRTMVKKAKTHNELGVCKKTKKTEKKLTEKTEPKKKTD